MIENTLVKSEVFEGTGINTVFPINFSVAKEEEIVPYFYNKEDNKLIKLTAEQYDIDFEQKTVEYPYPGSSVEPLKEGQYIIILRQTDITQSENSANKSFTSQDIERALDKLTRISQELADCCSRSIKFNPAQTINPEELDAQYYIDALNTILLAAQQAESRALVAVGRAEQKIEEANATLETAQEEVEVAKQSAAEAVSEARKATEANIEAQKALTETKVLAGDVSSGLASKQDKLTAGKNIKIEGRVISAEVPENAFGVDNTTIKRNANNTISTVAVKDENKGTVIRLWQGTLAEYNAIKNRLPATTIAHITDDAEVHLNLTEQDFVTNAVLESFLATKQPVGDYATNDDLNAGLDSKQPIGDYVTADELPDLVQAHIPTGVSAFVNDAGYLTEAPDVSIYATKASVPVTVEEVLSTKDYANKAEIPTVPTKVSELENDEGFVTNEDVDVTGQINELRNELLPVIESNTASIDTKQNIISVGEGLLKNGDTISAQIASATAFGVVKLIYTSGTGTLNIITE